MKKSLYVASKELEKIEQLVDANASMASKVFSDFFKGPVSNITIRFQFALRRKKLKETVKKGEDDYLYSIIDVESQRRFVLNISSGTSWTFRTTYNVLRKAVESLEAVERQRLAHCQTALGRLQRKLEQLGPNLEQVLYFQTNFNVI